MLVELVVENGAVVDRPSHAPSANDNNVCTATGNSPFIIEASDRDAMIARLR
jgi:hypothetical protein